MLVITNMYPTPARPYFGIFVERQVAALRRAGARVEVEPVAGERGESDYFLSWRRVARAIRTFRPDLIHYHYGYTPLAGAASRVPYVVTLCGDDLNGASDGRGGTTLKTAAGTIVTQLFASAAQHVIVKSAAMQRRLWPHARRRSSIVPNGVDTTLFRPGDRSAARAALGIAPDRLVLGFVNSIGQLTKRLDLATAVRDELVRRGRPAVLNVADAVAPADMPAFYQASDCLLMTSDREGAPNCVKESLACGVPVVGVPVGDLPDLITDPAMGLVVPRSPKALADAVESIHFPADRRRSLLPSRYTDECVAEEILGIYRTAIGRRAGSPSRSAG